ncbi:MAG: hypothetical protein ACT4RN_03000 [Pseudonocardia sp.]
MDGVLIDLGGLAGQPVAVVGVPVQNPEPPPGRGEEFGKASPVALVVILLLALATFLLVRNMTKRIKRLPESFDEPPVPGRDPEDAGGNPRP